MRTPTGGLWTGLALISLLLPACAARRSAGAEVADEPVPTPAYVQPTAAKSGADSKWGPVRYRINDAHFHLVDFLQKTEGIDAALAAMDRVGVDHVLISGMPLVKKWHRADPRQPLYYLEDDSRAYWYSATDVLVARAVQTIPAAQRHRFHPIICGFNGTDRNAVDHVKRMLDWYPDVFEGIGEVMARHDDLTALTYGESPRADHVALQPIYELAAARDLPVAVHSNISSVRIREPLYLHEMENAVKRNPRTRFIWCHAGISRRIDVPTLTDELRRMLRTYPNLWVDLSWVVYEDYIAPGGKPAPNWVKLVDEFPDRFLLGSDKVAKFGNLEDEIMKYYVFLDALAPTTRPQVAWENFMNVLPARVRARLAAATR